METLQPGFEWLKLQQNKNIGACIFNLQRYSKMKDRQILNEVGGPATTGKRGEELRRIVIMKEVTDIKSAQANIRLLTKLEQDYGKKNSISNLIADLQRDFGITVGTKS